MKGIKFIKISNYIDGLQQIQNKYGNLRTDGKSLLYITYNDGMGNIVLELPSLCFKVYQPTENQIAPDAKPEGNTPPLK